PWYQTRTVRGAAFDEGAGGADRRRVFDGARRKQIDLEQRLARETGGRNWDRNRKLPGAADQETAANDRCRLSSSVEVGACRPCDSGRECERSRCKLTRAGRQIRFSSTAAEIIACTIFSRVCSHCSVA